MELTEPIDLINKQLVEHFGSDTVTGLPMWRIVFSEDQYEKRLGTYDDYTPGGIYLRTVTEVREVPKYKQWIHERYVLENLVLVPVVNEKDLPTQKMSYEPLWVFQTGSGQYLPPKFEAAKLIIDTVYASMGKSSIAKYKDPDAGLTIQECHERKVKEIDNLQKELFGNETLVGDALAHKQAVIVPRNYKKRRTH
jgi:hypothetical protein